MNIVTIDCYLFIVGSTYQFVEFKGRLTNCTSEFMFFSHSTLGGVWSKSGIIFLVASALLPVFTIIDLVGLMGAPKYDRVMNFKGAFADFQLYNTRHYLLYDTIHIQCLIWRKKSICIVRSKLLVFFNATSFMIISEELVQAASSKSTEIFSCSGSVHVNATAEVEE
ncbi:hypothetical protein ACJX0J_022039, partial [Zea mays]